MKTPLISGHSILCICTALILTLFSSCVGEDIIEDTIDPVLRIDNPLSSLAIGETHQFEATYLNEVGQEEDVELVWSSSDPDIVSIEEDGLALGIQEGDVTISVALKSGELAVSSSNEIAINENTTIEDDGIRSGIIETTSSYALSGEFTMEAITDENIIQISIDEDYVASTALPGLYLYLTNNPNSVSGAFEVGPVTVFNGAHTYDISDSAIDLNQYSYLLYWCKPFSVKVGEGEIN